MNHCGRPECECYKKCWCDCDLCSEATGINHAGHTDKPVQEKTLNCCGRKEKDHILVGPHIICPTAPDAEVIMTTKAKWWDEVLDSVVENGRLLKEEADAEEWENVDTILEIWSFFRSAIEQAEKRGKATQIEESDYDFIKKDFIETGRKIERSRISEAIGKLRKPYEAHFGMGADSVVMAHNAALDAILKVIHEV